MAEIPTLVVAHPPGYAAERAYALDLVLGTVLGVRHIAHAEDRTDVSLSLGDGSELRVADVLFATPEGAWLTARALPAPPLAHEAGLPLLYVSPRPPPLAPGQAWLSLDVFGSAFFMVTRYEELVRTERDAHGRFPATASIAVCEGAPLRPLVHDYAELLWGRLQRLWPRLTRPRRKPRILPSHDVDWPALPLRPLRASARSLAADIVRRQDPRLAANRIRWECARRRGPLRDDPYDSFDMLMDVSEAAGARSAFYFLADGSYPLESVAPLLRRIHARGHEIGLHPGYASYRDAVAIAAELNALKAACARLGIEQETWGGRQHFLRWENPGTWQAWEEAGLDYDSTLGFADRGGFRTGTCVEYPAFNLRTRRVLRLRERPLLAMEGALLRGGLVARRRAERVLAHLQAEVHRVGGDFTLLWHNSNLLSHRDRELYRRTVLG